MTIHDMTGGVMPHHHHHHHLARSRFMITDILGGPPQPSPASPDRPRDLSLHCRTGPVGQQDGHESDGHESGTDSAGIPADSSSLGSN
ncbi:unnamed protein product, partial [Nesidiocoris tenuis]